MAMTMHTPLSPLVALLMGILILIFPRFLNDFIAVYLIVTGVIVLGALRERVLPLPRHHRTAPAGRNSVPSGHSDG